MTVSRRVAICSPSCPTRKLAFRKIDSPDAALKISPSRSRAMLDSSTTGTDCVGTDLLPSLRSVRLAAVTPISSGLFISESLRRMSYQ